MRVDVCTAPRSSSRAKSPKKIQFGNQQYRIPRRRSEQAKVFVRPRSHQHHRSHHHRIARICHHIIFALPPVSDQGPRRDRHRAQLPRRASPPLHSSRNARDGAASQVLEKLWASSRGRGGDGEKGRWGVSQGERKGKGGKKSEDRDRRRVNRETVSLERERERERERGRREGEREREGGREGGVGREREREEGGREGEREESEKSLGLCTKKRQSGGSGNLSTLDWPRVHSKSSRKSQARFLCSTARARNHLHRQGPRHWSSARPGAQCDMDCLHPIA
jgi:hypothetical protein